MDFPNYEPGTVPSGEYIGEIVTEVAEKVSQFDSNKKFLSCDMILRNPKGEEFDFTWSFSKKTPVYRNLLLVLGGKEQPSGIVIRPASMCNKLFNLVIIERGAKNDKSKLVNEITRVTPYEPVVSPAAIDEPEKEASEDSAEIPF